MRAQFRESALRVLAWCFLLSIALGLGYAQKSSREAAKHPVEVGRSIYNSSCAGCHGLDGHGGDKGANIAESMKLRSLPDAQLSGIISGGVPGTGMPAFSNLSETQIRAVVDYVRSLQGRRDSVKLSGDPRRGKEIFFGKGACSTCHAISGEGGFLGPDLSGYAGGASAAAVRNEITKDRRIPAYGYRAATLTVEDGAPLKGVIRNEDNFSIQFQSLDGAFHFLQKSDLHNFNRMETSLMPADFGQRLSADELNDLVAYLVKTAADAGSARRPEKKKDDFEW